MPIPPGEVSDRLKTALRARHYSLRTEEAYVGWVRRYAAFHGERPLDELGEGEICRLTQDGSAWWLDGIYD